MAKGRSSKEKVPPNGKETKDGSTKVSADDAEPAIVPAAGAEKKEQWNIARVISKDETIPCNIDGCEGVAVATWASNLDPDTKKDVCEPCQLKDYGGWPDGFDRTGGGATLDAAPIPAEAGAPSNTEKLKGETEEDATMIVDNDLSTMESADTRKDAVQVTQDCAVDAEAPKFGANTNASESDGSLSSESSQTATDMQVEHAVSQSKSDSSSGEENDLAEASDSLNSKVDDVDEDSVPQSKSDSSNGEEDDQVEASDSLNEVDEDVEEKWDLKKILSHSEITQKRPTRCATENCKLVACCVWVSNLSPDEEWHSCIDCQDNDFGGWPSLEELPIKAMDEDHIRTLAAKCSKKRSPDMPEFPDESVSPLSESIHDKSIADMQVEGPPSKNKSGSSNTEEENKSEASDPLNEVHEDGEEKWELKKIVSLSDLTKERPIKCSTEDCRLAACSLWVSNLSPDKWYSCIDCQHNDFGGWPPLEELPIKSTSGEHMRALATKCSKKKFPGMPNFADESLSPTKASNSGLATNTVTPPPNSVSGKQEALKGAKSTVTPTPGRPPQLTAGALKMHREWQKQAEKVGGPEARIIVSKPKAKSIIFDLLYDSFRPMNITQIHSELKATVPSPVLKSCLDEMALDRNENPFDESDDEDSEPKATKKSKPSSDDPYASSLAFKAGRNANTCLYFVDHTKQKNNGDGLEPDQRNQLACDSAKADADHLALSASLQRMTAEATQLLSEPTNEEASATLELQESAMKSIRDQLEDARKLKINEKHKKQTKKRIESMAAQWRKRKRLCMDFLITMEESTEGTLTVKKCLAGDGQIEIDSDESAIAGALAYGKKKRSRPPAKKMKVSKNLAGLGAKPQESHSLAAGLEADASFVAVQLDAMGQVCRVHLEDE